MRTLNVVFTKMSRRAPPSLISSCVLAIGMSLFSPAVQAGCTLASGSTVQASETVDISELLTLQDSAAQNRTATWAVPVNCWAITNDNAVHFVSPLGNGYWVNFINAAGVSRWIKFQVGGYVTKLSYKNVNVTLLGDDASYTLTATLLASDPGVTDTNFHQVTQSNSVTLVPLLMHNANIFGSVPDIDTAAATVANGSWTNDYLGYQSLNVIFNPPETTCEMPDQRVELPKVPLNALRQGWNTGSTVFTLPITCLNTLAGGATRAVKAWLTSADLVDENKQILRNSSSTAGGIGLTLSDSSGRTLTLADSLSEASSILDIASGGNVNVTPPALNVAYKIYDPAALSPGSVVATATLYFNYD